MTEMTARPRLPAAYWRVWWAAAADGAGDGAFAAAVPLLAVTLTRDPRLISVVSAAMFAPWLLLSLPAGALVDRHDRITLMWRSQALQAVIVGAVAVLAAAGDAGIAVLAGLGFGLGACEVVFLNAAQAVLPDLVPKELLHRANSHQYTVTATGQQFLGPPVGSLLFAVAVGLPFGLDAGSFALSAALLATLPRPTLPRPTLPRPTLPRRPATEPAPDPAAGHPPARAAIADGLRWLAGHRLLRTLALLVGVNTFCFQLGGVTLVLLATGVLHLGPRGYGLLLGAAAVGSVLGGLVNTRIVARTGALPAMLISLVANVVIFAGIGLSPDVIVLGVLLALNGFATMMWSVVTVSLRQQVVPSELLGRVNSAYRMLAWGLMPLGAVAGGLVAHEFGVRAAYPVAGVLRGAALLVALRILVPAMRDAARSPPGAPAAGG